MLPATPIVYGAMGSAPSPNQFPIGFSNKPTEQCHCEPARHASYPLYFCSVDRDLVQPPAVGTDFASNCCNTEVTVQDAPILGTKASFHYTSSSCCPCAKKTMAISEGGRPIGMVDYDPSCWCCCKGDTQQGVMATDALGKPRFQRIEPSCVPCGCDGGDYGPICLCGGFREKTWPIANATGQTVGGFTFRQHACAPKNHAMWVGYKQWPQGAESEEDRLLLMGIALMQWIHMGNTAENQGRLK